MKPSIQHLASSICFVVLLTLAVRPAAAQGTFTIFDNFNQPGDGYNSSSLVEVADFVDGGSPFYLSIGIPFTTGAGSNVTVSALLLAMQPMAAPESDVIITIREDNAGIPGTVIESLSANIATNGLHTFTSSLNPVLAGGTTYWIRAEAGADSDVGWYESGIYSGPTAYTFDGTTWDNQPYSPALKIEGVVPVPEPSTAILLGVGLLAFFGFLRYRSSRS